MAHALLSASSAHRWLKCPPSARIAAEFPDRESEAAREGTAAHESAEAFFKQWKIPEDPHVKAYVEYMQELIRQYHPCKYQIELRVDYSHIAPRGFGTADCVIYTKDMLHIVDFKYGKGVRVDAGENSQMILYALGACRTLGIQPSEIRFTIYQPRMDNISTWSLDGEELQHYADKIRPQAGKAWEGKGELEAGDHCTFCPYKTICPEFKQYFNEKYIITF